MKLHYFFMYKEDGGKDYRSICKCLRSRIGGNSCRNTTPFMEEVNCKKCIDLLWRKYDAIMTLKSIVKVDMGFEKQINLLKS